ncbi:MAG: hypothetical protein KGZ34_01920 [Nitrosarchaeum sp.]|nr:hypothetical protein [Nitrosarchaeum sp.]
MKREHLTFVLLAAIGIPLLSLSVQEASAHGNFEVQFGTNTNQTLRIVVGETGEPAYVDGVHNLEMRITDKLTGLPNAVAVKNNAGTDILSVDTYFYPKNLLVDATLQGAPPLIDLDGVGVGNPCSTSITANVQIAETGGISGCGPDPRFTDSQTGGGKARSVFGEVGIYTGPTSQYYTQYGRTLYHIYGQVNYFQNSPEKLANIDVWYDGKTVKVAYINGAKATINGGFGLADITQTYWPGPGGSSVGTSGITNATTPDNLRNAIGQDRNNGIDIWNFLRDITNAINTIAGIDTVDPVPPAK